MTVCARHCVAAQNTFLRPVSRTTCACCVFCCCSATRDSRFHPIKPEEIPSLSCTVSLLRCFEEACDWRTGRWGGTASSSCSRTRSSSAASAPRSCPRWRWSSGGAGSGASTRSSKKQVSDLHNPYKPGAQSWVGRLPVRLVRRRQPLYPKLFVCQHSRDPSL